jgi:anti-sigma B factor antagonist
VRVNANIDGRAPMTVSVSRAEGVTTARLTGEIDTYTVPDVRAAFEHLDVPPQGMVVADLRDVTFLDSSGIGAIIGLYHRVTDEDARLRVVCNDTTLRLMRLTHLDQVLDVVGSDEGADDARADGDDRDDGDSGAGAGGGQGAPG